MRRPRLAPIAPAITALPLLLCACEESAPYYAMPAAPAEALLPAGTNQGTLILPGGRSVTPTGTQTEVGGYPADVTLHPSLDVAYVNNTGYATRGVQVLRRSDGMMLQSITVQQSWHGMALTPDASELAIAGGDARNIRVYSVNAADGTLTLARTLSVGAYTAGIAYSADGTRLYTNDFASGRVLELDPATGSALRSLDLGGTISPFAILNVPGRGELYVTDGRGHALYVVELGGFSQAAAIELGSDGPLALASTPSGDRVFVTLSDGDRVVAIATASRTITGDVRLGEAPLEDDEGVPLAAISPSGLAFEPTSNRLFVARAADNVVAVLDAATLAPLGTVPVGWYPTDVAVVGNSVVVTNGKGIGAGPTSGNQGKELMSGTVSTFAMDTLDLAERTAASLANWERPDRVFHPDAGGKIFPVPTTPGGPTPIEHIVLIVRENKTYDSVLGDLAGTEADPSLLMWDETITPNAHAIARQFTNHDNFYDDGETSVQGHFWLTYNFCNHFMEHVSWMEDYRGSPGFGSDPAKEASRPDFGSYFQHLIRHGIDYRIFGEVVGYGGKAVDPYGNMLSTANAVDVQFPGIFFNTDIADVDKADYVVGEFGLYGLPQFTYLLLPNDHTQGVYPGGLTPRSMIADNDEALGRVIEGITHLPQWESTAIFVVQDDTQSGQDHVDLHRSLLFVISPWGKQAYTSHVHTSYPSLFRTFDHILGIPPLNRLDALATPLYDSFDTTPDLTPYTAIPRTFPPERTPTNFKSRVMQVAASWSQQIDWSVPDGSASLGDILYAYRFGVAPPGSVLGRVAAGEIPDPGPASMEAEDQERYREGLRLFRAALAHDPWLELRLGADGLDALRVLPR